MNAAFRDTCCAIGRTVNGSVVPHRYHSHARISEANTLYHFLKALESGLETPRVYLEFTFDTGFADAIVVAQSSLFVLEAKSTIRTGTGQGLFGTLEDQTSRMEDPKCTLGSYVRDKIVVPFRGEQWGSCNITEAWGVILADTFEPRWRNYWLKLESHREQFPVLSTYRTDAHQNQACPSWWHLLGFRRLPSDVYGLKA